MSSLFKALERAETERRSPTAEPARPSDGSKPIAPPRPTDVFKPVVDLPEPCTEYERLRVMITLAANQVDLRSVMLVSALAGEGVSTVTLGLATAAVDGTSSELLLVDADFASPTLAGRLGVSPRHGLSDILGKRATRAEAVARTPVSRLLLLDGGRGAVDVTSARTQDALQGVFEDIRAAYELVIVDGGSLATCPESILLSRHVDGVVIVVRAERTPADLVADATTQLRGAGARLLGVVMNRRRQYIPATIARRL